MSQDQSNIEKLSATKPDPREVSAFWEVARMRVGHANLEFILGQEYRAAVEPPWMQLSETANEATELADRLAVEGSIVTASPADQYPDGEESLPLTNSLVIVCDGAGKPAVLAKTVGTLETDQGDGRIVEETLSRVYAR